MCNWNLGHLFALVADALTDREAMVAGATRLSYGELDDRANRAADVLLRSGVGRGETVALALRNGHEYLEAMLGAFKIGAMPVNVNTRYTADELHHLLGDAGVVFVLHEPELDERIVDATAGWRSVRGHLARGPSWEDALATADPSPPPVTADGDGDDDDDDDDRYILYTGGTTGRPKGVVWRHEDLFFAALGGGNPGGDPVTLPKEVVAHARHGRIRCLPASPFAHGTAHWMALATLLNGGTVVVSDDAALRPRHLWDLVQAEDVTMLVIVGDAFGRPLGDALAAEPGRWELGRLLVVLSGGATLSSAVRQELLRHLPGAVVVDGYGTSETGGQGNMAVWPGQADGGLPRFQIDDDTAVLDDAGRPTAPGTGVIGRLARRGRIPLGYHGDPAGSSQTFPVIDGERWAVPGDMGRLEADGSVTLFGRGTSSINSGGEKVFPAEVEAVLKAHPAVLDAVVIGIPDDRWGEQVSAVVQVRPGRQVVPPELAAHCRTQLADFKVPRRLVLVEHLQRRPTGKPDYAWARAVIEPAVSGHHR